MLALSADLRRQRRRLRGIAPADDHLMPVAGQQAAQAFAEDAIAADDGDPHPMIRARKAGSGTAQSSARPKTAMRLRAMRA